MKWGKMKQRKNMKKKQKTRRKRTKRESEPRDPESERGRQFTAKCKGKRCNWKPKPTLSTDRCFPYTPIPQVKWKQSPTEKFMERLWAFKRINYLLGNHAGCTKGIDKFAKNNGK